MIFTNLILKPFKVPFTCDWLDWQMFQSDKDVYQKVHKNISSLVLYCSQQDIRTYEIDKKENEPSIDVCSLALSDSMLLSLIYQQAEGWMKRDFVSSAVRGSFDRFLLLRHQRSNRICSYSPQDRRVEW